MSVKSVWLAGLLVVGACAANAQTTPVYWSTDANLACGAYGDASGKPMQLGPNAGAGAGNYVCYVYGTLPWYASGGAWGSSIRVTAPASASVAYFLDFKDENAVDSTLDFIYQGDPKVYSDISASQALFPNQPLEVNVLGLHSQAPNYGTIATGPVTVLAECPDSKTCADVQAQLIYSSLPSQPWSLSSPVTWDWQTSLAWSAVGVDDSKTNTDPNTKNLVSFVIYNLDTGDPTKVDTSHSYTINVYNADGILDASKVTGAVPGLGSYAVVLTDLLPKLPSGAFKLQVVGSSYSAFEALQFHGPSATMLVSAAETVPTLAVTAKSAVGRTRQPSPAAMPLVRSLSAR